MGTGRLSNCLPTAPAGVSPAIAAGWGTERTVVAEELVRVLLLLLLLLLALGICREAIRRGASMSEGLGDWPEETRRGGSPFPLLAVTGAGGGRGWRGAETYEVEEEEEEEEEEETMLDTTLASSSVRMEVLTSVASWICGD